MSEYCIKALDLVGQVLAPEDATGPFGGQYLKSYDPEAHDGQGWVEWTWDKNEALRFSTPKAAVECYRRQPSNRPIRADGHPNRPLTAFGVEISPI